MVAVKLFCQLIGSFSGLISLNYHRGFRRTQPLLLLAVLFGLCFAKITNFPISCPLCSRFLIFRNPVFSLEDSSIFFVVRP